jgi:hypothetical protein
MIYHIMGKPLHRQFLLAPKEGVSSLCGAVVAMARRNWPELNLYGFVFMSNHNHLTDLAAAARFHLAATERAINISALIEEIVAHEAARKKITGRKPVRSRNIGASRKPLLPHGGASAEAN